MPVYVWVILAIYFGFGLLEFWRTNLFHKPGQQSGDGVVEAVSIVFLQFAIQPAIVVLVNVAMTGLAPDWRNALAGLNVLAGLGLFLICDDMTQYWWHRASHKFAWLYHLHRAHHNGQYMSMRIVYRNNLFYYVMMPGLWLSALLVFLGLGWIYAGYVVVKQCVIIAAHSDVAWDRPLYRIKALSPLMWLVERTISTPATHHAHHGRHKNDPATYYKGNYGNLLFFWDVLFRTARITRSYPQSFGVENLVPASAGQLLLWPLVQQEQSEAAAA